MSVLQKIYSEVIKKIFSDETVQDIAKFINAVDPWKWGSPLTEGEGHYINEVVVDEFYDPGGDNQERTALNLLEIYEEELQEDFAYFRRGWVAEYIGETFAENEFRRLLFLMGARLPGGGAIVESLEAVNRDLGSADSLIQKTFAIIWASFFFYLSAALIGFSHRLIADPMSALDPAIFPILLVWWLSYAKWYGKYGCYMPIVGSQGFVSAMATVGLWVFSFRVLFELAPFLSMDGFPMFCGWNGGLNFPCGDDPVGMRLSMPNPLLLGAGHLVKNMAWPTVLLLWGLSGIGNIFYGEWAEHHSTIAEFKEKVIQEYKAGKREGESHW